MTWGQAPAGCLKARGERADELAALAATYNLRAALGKKDGDFRALVKQTKDVLNRDAPKP